MVSSLFFSLLMISLFEEKHMKKQAGFLEPQTVLVLLVGVLIFISAVLITYDALVHWAVGEN